ncbi:MAG: A/G-specific adenine glycosylase [Desulfovibrionaceae bacterium]|nr:A/G-specific adenine glycosylase [Desulfovibrionaceae bacterium]MBF0513063.1 A/G-specific adenine glycosylase [Desulfovibrionaceae bacterium]
MSSSNAIASLLLAWFEKSARPLPWRETYDPYQVWISEIMLQQTRMDRAVVYFNRWMQRFPDARAVAAADIEDVHKLWEGLGYYSRAKNIHKAARIVVSRHGGRLPDDPAALRALPGIGDYTAGAIASLAFGRDEPAVDANAVRLLSRLFDVDEPVSLAATKKRLAALARELIPKGRARQCNQAVMELGALVCTPKKPRCGACPVSAHCRARHLDIVPERPVLGPAKAVTPLTVASGLLIHEGRVFIQKRTPSGVWAGLWEFPGGRVEPGETPEAAVVREFAEETEMAVAVANRLAVIKHGYTTYRVTLHCFALRLADPPAPPAPVLHAATRSAWARLADLDGLAFPAGHRKLIDRLAAEPALAKLLGIS